MDNSLSIKNRNKRKRAQRTRRALQGTQLRPRLCVVKTNAHVHIQLIDDDKSETLASASTNGREFRNKDFGRNKESAKKLGLKLAELAASKNIKKVLFDRGPFKYHGVIAAVAEGAREGGLEL
jgi:large subunit ribosomal protein L18